MRLRSTLVLASLIGVIGCNAKQPPPADATVPVAKTAPKVVFIGDSVTALWDQPNFGLPEFSLQPKWIDEGVVGLNSAAIWARFEYYAVDQHPDIIFLLAGTNDVYPGWAPNCGENDVAGAIYNSCTDIESMVSEAKAAGIKVILATIPPWNCSDPVKCALAVRADDSEARYIRIDNWNAWLTQYAFDNNLTIADFHAALTSDGKHYINALTFDGVHPSAAGYQILYPLVESAINQQTN